MGIGGGRHLIGSGVLGVAAPGVGVGAALNFRTLVWHTRAELVAYLRHVRGCLRPKGVFVMDLYGGTVAQRLGKQARPGELVSGERFTYEWEQRAFDAVTGRTDCRIHFELADGTRKKNAFGYDWRLWSPPELVEAMHDAGFDAAAVWGPAPEAAGSDTGSGRFRPITGMPGHTTGEDWVVYVVGVKGAGA